jgi:hypothetical protein
MKTTPSTEAMNAGLHPGCVVWFWMQNANDSSIDPARIAQPFAAIVASVNPDPAVHAGPRRRARHQRVRDLDAAPGGHGHFRQLTPP